MTTKYLTLKVATVTAAAMLAAIVMGSASTRAEDKGASLAAAKSAINQVVNAIRTNDADAFGAVMVRDPGLVAFGTDKAERWVGYDQLMQSVRAQLKVFQTTGIAVRDEVVHVLPSNDGAYFSEVWDWKIRTDGKDMALNNLRMTGVLVNRDGHWQCAQFHISMPVGSQAVTY